jgi:hypothetical protein
VNGNEARSRVAPAFIWASFWALGALEGRLVPAPTCLWSIPRNVHRAPIFCPAVPARPMFCNICAARPLSSQERSDRRGTLWQAGRRRGRSSSSPGAAVERRACRVVPACYWIFGRRKSGRRAKCRTRRSYPRYSKFSEFSRTGLNGVAIIRCPAEQAGPPAAHCPSGTKPVNRISRRGLAFAPKKAQTGRPK